MRIFVDEKDRRGLQPLYTAIVELLRREHISGATVFRGIEGYGSHDQLHVAKALSWFPNLPILIEVVEEEDRLLTILPSLKAMIGEGMITLEAARYLRLGKP